MLYGHAYSGNESLEKRFSMTQRFKEEGNHYSHRQDRSNDLTRMSWESQFTMPNETFNERIARERPPHMIYALVAAFKEDGSGYRRVDRNQIDVHRRQGFKAVPASRHRKASMMADQIYQELDMQGNSFTSRHETHDQFDEMDQKFIISGQNILMERPMEEQARYEDSIYESNRSYYDYMGPNGKANNDENNPRMLGMKYIRDEGRYADTMDFLTASLNLNL